MKKLFRTIFFITFLTSISAVTAKSPVPLKDVLTKTGEKSMGNQSRTSGGITFLLLFGVAYGTRKLYAIFDMKQQH